MSRFPSSTIIDPTVATETLSEDEIKAVFNGVINQSKGGGSWIPIVNNINASLREEENQLLYDQGSTPVTLDTNHLQEAQSKEEWIKFIKDMKDRNADVT